MFERRLGTDRIESLKSEELFTGRLKRDIENKNVFPAIRVGRMDFYHKGGKLFRYDGEFRTHKKYASTIKSDSDYVSESDLQNKVEIVKSFSTGYEQIKENCSLYSGPEAQGVSRIYHKSPFTNGDLTVVVLDIEISFQARTEDRSQDRIDILLFNKATQRLRFYEAKHFSNSELWADKGQPRVVSQIRRYEEQIYQEHNTILSQYKSYVEIMNSLFGSNLPEPESIDEKVTLLLFGYDTDQQGGRMQKLLGSLSGIQHYFIGNISAVKTDNMWKAVRCS